MKNQLILLTVLFTTLSTMAQELTKTPYNDGSAAHLSEAIIVNKTHKVLMIHPAEDECLETYFIVSGRNFEIKADL